VIILLQYMNSTKFFYPIVTKAQQYYYYYYYYYYGDVTSAGWQVTQCDPMWHVSSRSGEAGVLRT